MRTKYTHRTAGVTLVELLITVVIGVAILGLTFTIVMANRNLMTIDQVGTELNQNLRIGADIMGDDIRIAGQGILAPTLIDMPLVIQDDQIVIRNRFIDPITGNTDVERLTYWLQGDILMLRVDLSNDGGLGITFDNGADQGVINKVQTMNVSAVLQVGNVENTVDTLDEPNQWRNLQEVRVQLIGATDIRGKTHTSELTSSFFPRNVLSR